jgi:hypothetical protein
MWCVAGPHTPPGDQSVRASLIEPVSDTYSSALELARGFGSTVFEPSWWPAHIGEISYSVNRFRDRAHYFIGSTRRDEVPICVIGRHEVSEARRSPTDWLPGEWREPLELAQMQGLIGRVGIPPRLRAFVYDEELTIQLIGYDNETEIMSALKSLRRVRLD